MPKPSSTGREQYEGFDLARFERTNYRLPSLEEPWNALVRSLEARETFPTEWRYATGTGGASPHPCGRTNLLSEWKVSTIIHTWLSGRSRIRFDGEPGEENRSLVLPFHSRRVDGESPRLIHRLLLLFGRIPVQVSCAGLDIASPDKRDFSGVGVELGLTPVIPRSSVRQPDVQSDCEDPNREHHFPDREPHDKLRSRPNSNRPTTAGARCGEGGQNIQWARRVGFGRDVSTAGNQSTIDPPLNSVMPSLGPKYSSTERTVTRRAAIIRRNVNRTRDCLRAGASMA
jgi:hypothetical protein